MMIDWLLFLVAGLLAGVLSGLIGVGGGLVMVPVMVEWLTARQLAPDHIMHISVGTSLGAMAITTAASAYTHSKVAKMRWDLVKRLAPTMIIGVSAGVLVADQMPSDVLKQVFAVVVMAVALQLLFFQRPQDKPPRPLPLWFLVIMALLGVLAGMVGLGGGVFIVPLLLLFGVSIREAVGVSLWSVLPTVTIGLCISIWTGMNESGLPDYSFGYAYLPALIAIALASIVSVPAGVWLSYKLPKQVVQRVFGVFLVLISIRMFIS